MTGRSNAGSPLTDRARFLQDPYPFYQALRDSRQPYWLGHTQITSSPGVWLFSRYEDALAIFKETARTSKNIRTIRPPGYMSPFDLNLLFQDGAEHVRLRRLVADFFSVRAMKRLEPYILETADALISGLMERPSFDLIDDFAEPLPLLVIARLIGIPKEDLQQIRRWSRDLGDGFDSLSATPDILQRQRVALADFIDYVRGLITSRPQSACEDDLLAFLAPLHARGEIGHDDLVGMVGFLLFAGHETTINLIGNGLWLLLTHPGSWAALKEQPELMPGAVEEILRFESPEQRTSFRIALEPIELGGHHLEPGDQFGAIIGAANRDPAQFPDPDVFDIRRTPNRHLAFGLGVHMCLGKLMARTEATVALGRLVARCPGIELADAVPRWRPNSFFRGLADLPARISG